MEKIRIVEVIGKSSTLRQNGTVAMGGLAGDIALKLRPEV
jgi:hypothetical protein